MIVSASYNFFNGEEHLIPSLKALRGCVEHISIVWQSVSNAGEMITVSALEALRLAQDMKLIDDVIYFKPDLNAERNLNELRKRTIGLELAKHKGATHFLSMDADEFYRESEFLSARAMIRTHGWTSTSVQSFLHVKRPIWRAADTTCCCFITELNGDTVIGDVDFPHPNIDPTRKMTSNPDNHHHFDVSTVAMYHMNLVRSDLSQKLRNTTTRDVLFLAEVNDVVSKWEGGPTFYFPKKGNLDIIRVKNEFSTFDPSIK